MVHLSFASIFAAQCALLEEQLSPEGWPYASSTIYHCLFGRDSIITSLQTLPVRTDLAYATLKVLAELQGKCHDAIREEEPGRIVHEYRIAQNDARAELLRKLGWKFPYYGTVDATMLYIILVWETFRRTQDLALLETYAPVVLAAITWMQEWGDRDGDGFIEYRSNSHALTNQGWKDSVDSLFFSDGRLPDGPIALIEVQGYAVRAWQAASSIARRLGQTRRAAEYRREAQRVKEQIVPRFFLPERGIFAPALDGAKRPLDIVTSNPAHLLWAGVLDAAYGAQLIATLRAPDMWTPWGVRTLSDREIHFKPGAYHNGSIWPMDNYFVYQGLRRYGRTDLAHLLRRNIVDATSALGGAPELYAVNNGALEAIDEASPIQAWTTGCLINLLAPSRRAVRAV